MTQHYFAVYYDTEDGEFHVEYAGEVPVDAQHTVWDPGAGDNGEWTNWNARPDLGRIDVAAGDRLAVALDGLGIPEDM